MTEERILIIDDEPLIRRALADYLEEYGYETETASDGLKGLTQAQAEQFHVVLVDLRMPNMDGLEVIAALKEEQPKLPVVVVSGTGVLNDVIEAMRRGAWDYVTKPVHDMDEIVVVINRVLEKARLIAERNRYQRELEQLNRSLEAEVARQTRDLRMRNRDLIVLNRVISATVSAQDTVDILRLLCEELALAFNVPLVTAALIDVDNPMSVDACDAPACVVAEYCDSQCASTLGLEIPLNSPSLLPVIEKQQPFFIPNIQTDTWHPASTADKQLSDFSQDMRDRGIMSLLLAPLIVRGQIMGTLALCTRDTHTYSIEDLNLVQNAVAAAARALEAVSLQRELQEYAEALEETVAQRTEELRAALKQAQAADKAKSQFISNISHEVRTPLTSIDLYLGLLQHGRDDQKAEYVKSLARETRRLQTLIEGILDISRLDLGKVTANPEPVDLNKLLATLVNDRRVLFAERDLQITLCTTPNLPLTNADPKLLEQVATNLLTNALHYTPAGGEVDVKTSINEDEEQRWISFSVRDTGPGISEEEQQHLFERFYRGTAGQASAAPGTGLGLAISKEIVNLHHGRLTVDSAAGEGATFTVWLPCESPPASVQIHQL